VGFEALGGARVSVEYRLMRAIMRGMGLPPLSMMRALGGGLGRTAYVLDERHRTIIRDNLSASFPESDAAWVDATAKACYAHLGKVALEIPRLLSWPREKIIAHVRVMQPERMERMHELKAKGQGSFMLTGHIGNWEWLNMVWGWLAGPADVVARPIDYAPADRLVTDWRSRAGQKVIPKAGSARMILRSLKQGKFIGILLDQNVDWYDGEWVDFFGRPACSNKGLALLAMKTKAPVIPVWCWRGDDGIFEMHIGREMKPIITGDKIQDVWDNTQAYTKALEDIIRQKPEQWFWLHQRWKTKPYHLWPRERN
jgi:KDO2-lipid IV(A) lauroyltransferase